MFILTNEKFSQILQYGGSQNLMKYFQIRRNNFQNSKYQANVFDSNKNKTLRNTDKKHLW